MLKKNKDNILFIITTIIISMIIGILSELVFFNSSIIANTFFFSLSRTFAVSAILSGLAILIKFRCYFFEHLERAFLLIAILMGVVWVTIFPAVAYNSPDDQIHFQNAYMFMDAKPTCNDAAVFLTSRKSAIGGKSLVEIDTHYKMIDEMGQNKNLSTFNRGGSPELYKTIIYLPFYIGFKVGEILHLDFTITVRLAKIFNLACYITLMFFAIKISGKLKQLFFILALLVPNLFYATQFSYDPLITGSITLALALFFRMLESEKAPAKYLFGLVVLLTFGSLTKAIYCPLLLLVFFIPNSKFDSKKRAVAYRVISVVIMLLLASTFVLPMLGGTMQADVRGGDTSVSGQLGFILSEPAKFVGIMAAYFGRSGADLLWGQEIFAGMGAGTSWSHTKFITPLVHFISALLVFSVVFMSSLNREIFTKKMKVGLALAYILAAIGIIGAMYLTFTPVGAMRIEGAQPRYFLPMFAIPLVLLTPARKKDQEYPYKNLLLFIPYVCLSLIAITYILRLAII